MTVQCQRGCGRSWPRDPVLEVPCSECKAPVGVWCRRPSGHKAQNPHATRDIAADRAGHYGRCPLGLCGLETVARRKRRETEAQAKANTEAKMKTKTGTGDRTPDPDNRQPSLF